MLPRTILRGSFRRRLIATSLVLARSAIAQSPSVPPPNEDGYDLWLRYHLVANAMRLAVYRAAARSLVVDGDSPTLAVARNELTRGLEGLLGRPQTLATTLTDGSILVGSRARAGLVKSLPLARDLARLGDEGYLVRATTVQGKHVIVVAGNTDVGALYGAFRLLRQVQTNGSLAHLAIEDRPHVALRLLDHWDNLDRTVERGYAGKSLWEWARLPDSISPRYRDYARANASLGINGAVLTNVNANAKVLTPEYLAKVAALANVFRPYGIRVYLTARFSAPIEIGALKTADPLDSAVRVWWKAKVDEIYRYVPDFGGFLVKANSEGQPGPQDYKRSHADGANMLADAVAPHGGLVMWRAFVYSNAVPADRVKQAYDEFKPLDGSFRDNVLVQVKNGPLDFQPREPFHPLFGAMPKTPLMMEFQITKEYLGQDTHLVYLGELFEEVLRSDTYAKGKGSTVARVIDGSLDGYRHTGIAGVSNIGTDRDWTGSQFNQANWYAFGRLAWDPTASSRAIADDWIGMTFSNDPRVVSRIEHMMLVSREAVVNYMTPLGLAHIMATGHHYGPGPWARLPRPDQTPLYFHRADTLGLGFDRTAAGSNAVAQYFPPVRDLFASRDSVPENLLLWFHHVRWDERLRSGRTLWEELVRHYTAGVDTVQSMERTWKSLRGAIDPQRFAAVDSFLVIQEHEARWWRDAALSYFQTFSRRPIPAGFEPPLHPLTFYENLKCPANRDKPRCPEIYR
ncbi:MAG TPA: alpha-glucuronidase family glycosyl hydrolase [Gemmatimonadaceae bacterium]|nr:alpha-glucuronidase family glycosyl hydrolase [Gemmatimonadaceae bacterium]